MSNLSAFIYSDEYLKYQFGSDHPFNPIREKYTLELLKRLEIFNGKAKIYYPKPASEEDLLLIHSKRYIEFVKTKSKEGIGYLDYGDTPASKGIYEAACIRVGGTLMGADLLMRNEVNHAFNPGGGFHHAKIEKAAGFCVFNDIAIVVKYLQKKYNVKKIAIIDIDGHHGDGTQEIFYKEPILKISFHRYDDWPRPFYPGTGKIEEIGEEKGLGFSVNIPLPIGTGDEDYLYAFNEIVPRLIENYKPEILIHQFGVDAHYQDPLVHLSLTTKAYKEISEITHELAHKYSNGKYLILGGGGYEPENVARCWAIMFITISESKVKDLEAYNKLFDPLINKERKPKVKEVVEKVKKLIFPLHNIEC
jgi:acetoin utilization protein AcuC